MIVENVIQVLRLPAAPNACYHTACYQDDGSEVVVRVYRLIRDEPCAGCHGMVSDPPMEAQARIEQLVLL
jgi:hypothetical protein